MSIALHIGRPTIDKAASGQAVDVGHGITIFAADDLFHASPYAEIERLKTRIALLEERATEALKKLEKGSPGWGVAKDLLRLAIANK